MLTYRDKMVRMIQEAGQELIDRVENMVSDSLDWVSGFSISIRIPNNCERDIPVIEYTVEIINKNTIARMTGKDREELH